MTTCVASSWSQPPLIRRSITAAIAGEIDGLGLGLRLRSIGDVVALRLGLERIDAGFEVVEGLEFLLRHAFPRVLGDHHVQAFRPSKVLSSLSDPWAKAWRGDLRAVPRRSTDGGSVCMAP